MKERPPAVLSAGVSVLRNVAESVLLGLAPVSFRAFYRLPLRCCSDIVVFPQLAADVFQIGVDEALRDAEHAETFDEVLPAVARDDDLV